MEAKNLLKFISIGLFLFANSALAEVNWKVSPARTNIKFKVKHFVLMEVEGKFKNAQGLVTTSGEQDFSNAHVQASIPVSTVNTGNIDRDTHLKQDVFFNANQYPEMTFKSSRVIKKSGNEYSMVGSLTIRGVTRPVIFDVVSEGVNKSNDGKLRSKFVATATVNRYDYGLKWNELTEAGAMVVGEKVDIIMDVTLEKANTSLASVN